jgi:predicted metal-dependent hydrolase
VATRQSGRDKIEFKGQPIEYGIIHRPAVTRRIHLEIDQDGDLQVVSPAGMSRRAINKILQQRVHHVARFLLEARARQNDLPVLRYVSGEEHLYLGRRYPLEISLQPGKRGRVLFGAGTIQVVTARQQAERIRNQLLRWYRQQAQQHFLQRLAVICGEAPWTAGNVPPMRLRKMKRTWGNCSSEGLVTFNSHLIKAPAGIIDYVIAHEVCHLREHNHGKGFYELQHKLFPNWREARTQLKAQGHIYLH